MIPLSTTPNGAQAVDAAEASASGNDRASAALVRALLLAGQRVHCHLLLLGEGRVVHAIRCRVFFLNKAPTPDPSGHTPGCRVAMPLAAALSPRGRARGRRPEIRARRATEPRWAVTASQQLNDVPSHGAVAYDDFPSDAWHTRACWSRSALLDENGAEWHTERTHG